MIKKIIPIVLLIIAVVFVLEMKKRDKLKLPHACPDRIGSYPFPGSIKLPDGVCDSATCAGATHEVLLPRMLDLGAGKCVPCKTMAPILDEMKATFAGQLDVVFIDVWENEGVSEKYGVRMIPTQIFYDAEGNELFRHEGFYAREDMLSKWQELGYDFEGST